MVDVIQIVLQTAKLVLLQILVTLVMKAFSEVAPLAQHVLLIVRPAQMLQLAQLVILNISLLPQILFAQNVLTTVMLVPLLPHVVHAQVAISLLMLQIPPSVQVVLLTVRPAQIPQHVALVTLAILLMPPMEAFVENALLIVILVMTKIIVRLLVVLMATLKAPANVFQFVLIIAPLVPLLELVTLVTLTFSLIPARLVQHVLIIVILVLQLVVPQLVVMQLMRANLEFVIQFVLLIAPLVPLQELVPHVTQNSGLVTPPHVQTVQPIVIPVPVEPPVRLMVVPQVINTLPPQTPAHSLLLAHQIVSVVKLRALVQCAKPIIF